MTARNVGIEDIFKGAEKIEIFGKLPAMLWAYIDTGRGLIEELELGRHPQADSLRRLERLLTILLAAADFLQNRDLQGRLDGHRQILDQLSQGGPPAEGLTQSFTNELSRLEGLAGQRKTDGIEHVMARETLDHELDKVEKIKTGRSADIVVSMDLLDEIREYLSREALSEGISSVLIIDNAGTLIVNVGNKIELDAVGLAAVAAANFAATEQIARLIGERDFVLLFYKGHTESFHFSRVGEEYIIVTIFSNALSLGLVRLKIAEVARVLRDKLPKREG
jgi:predicted regulator of Ras-like GTPase activity (Roadblock/LC7/MglB family)